MVTWVDSPIRARAPWRPGVARCRGYKGTFTVLLFSFGMLFLPFPDTFLSTYRISRWVLNIVQFSFIDKHRVRSAMPGCRFCLLSAAAWPPKKKSEEQSTKGENHPEETGDQEQQAKQEEQPQSKGQSPRPKRPTSLFRESTASLQHFLQSSASDTLHPLRRGSFKFPHAGDSPSSPFAGVDDRLFTGHDVSGRHTGHFLCDMRRVTGCQANSDMNPFPIFNMLASTSRDYSCTRPVEDDFGGDESEDEYRAASKDESAAPCLTADRQYLRRSWSILEPMEGSTTGSLLPPRSEFSTRSLIGRKSTASLPGKLSPSVTGSVFSFMRPKPPGALPPGGIPLPGLSLLPREVTEEINPELFAGVEEDESSEDEVDAAADLSPESLAPDDEPKEGFARVPDEVDSSARDATRCLRIESTSDLPWVVDAVHQYESSTEEFKATTQYYAEPINTYYTQVVTAFELHPSGCAKHNIAALVDHVRNEASLFYATNLSHLLHFVVRLLWRGMQLVAACFPQYKYALGRNESTVLRLPHFIRIFEESLAAIAREPETEADLMQRWDAACKAQSAAAQGEAALGAVGSVVMSGMTTSPSELVDVVKLGDLLTDIGRLPLMTGRLLLLLADLCRTAFEMSEPLAQTFFCQEQPTDDAAEIDPAVEESVAYCKAESAKFGLRFEETQQAAKDVAQHALVIYNKLVLLDVLPEKTGSGAGVR